VNHKNTYTHFSHNTVNYWQIFEILSTAYSAVNLQYF